MSATNERRLVPRRCKRSARAKDLVGARCDGCRAAHNAREAARRAERKAAGKCLGVRRASGQGRRRAAHHVLDPPRVLPERAMRLVGGSDTTNALRSALGFRGGMRRGMAGAVGVSGRLAPCDGDGGPGLVGVDGGGARAARPRPTAARKAATTRRTARSTRPNTPGSPGCDVRTLGTMPGGLPVTSSTVREKSDPPGAGA